jgi:hypothetical protein
MSTMLDEIGSAHMTQGVLTSFIEDRFGCPNSALALNGGWTQVPPGIYFDTREFTISVWIYPELVGVWARMIDFSNSLLVASNNIILSLDSVLNNLPTLNVINGLNSIGECRSSKALLNGEWHFLTATFNGSLESIYINGKLTCSRVTASYILPKTIRTYNYIGKSYNTPDGYSWSYIDELRFYNKSLNEMEIIQLYNQTSKYKTYWDGYKIFDFSIFFFSPKS